MTNPKYKAELDNFSRNFAFCGHKRIVLYGIGRYTATLLEGINGFNIVGLMDRDSGNIGKTFFGLPVLDAQDAKNNADLIIINTSGTYWDLIYQRIKNIGLPVYFQNGTRAEDVHNDFEDSPYWHLSAEEVKMAIRNHEIISFDFYDTLFSRQLCDPDDVFRMLDHEMKNIFGDSCHFAQARKNALNNLQPNYDFEEVYAAMACRHCDAAWLEWAKKRELELERTILAPRREVICWLQYAKDLGKEIYILTDMYLPSEFFVRVLQDNNIDVKIDHLLISGAHKESKRDGCMWSSFSAALEAKILHIGDNEEADIKMPMRYGIDCIHILDKMMLLQVSTLRSLASCICGLYDSSIMGCVLSRLFENPLVLNKSKGKISISSNYDMGYCIFGPVILTFLLWLVRRSRQDNIRRLVFMSRDGWFLHKEYEFLCDLLDIKSHCRYILISRQLAMSASIETETDMDEYINMPWSGSHSEMLEDRFGFKYPVDESDLRRRQWEHVDRQKRNYRRYLSQFKLTSEDAIVDLGFYGNNQRYLNKLLNLNMAGYYFNANLSPDNPNAISQKMAACFQSENDLSGSESKVLEKQIYLESFLTAPYGMVAEIDNNGLPVYRKKGGNQKNFSCKVEIDHGARQFMADWARSFASGDLRENPAFVDVMYGAWFAPGVTEFGEDVKAGFYNDNAMMHRFDAPLFA